MVSRTVVVLALLALVVCVSASYDQVISRRSTFAGGARVADWPQLPTTDCQQLTRVPTAFGDSLWWLSSIGLYSMNIAGTLSSVSVLGISDWSYGTRIIALPIDNGRASLVATPRGAVWITCTSTIKCSAMGSLVSYAWGPVIGLAIDNKRSILWIATSSGLYRTGVNVGSPIAKEDRVDHACTAIEFDDNADSLAVGTDWKLWRLNAATNTWRYEWAWGVMDNNITSLTWQADGTLFIGNSDALNWQLPTGEFGRMSGLHGLPAGNITYMQSVDQGVAAGLWVASKSSLALYQPKSRGNSVYGPWKYFNGQRYLPDGSITTLFAWSATGQIFCATPTGLAVFTVETWTLAKKADLYESIIRPRHDRHGLTSEVRLRIPGDVASWDPNHQSDNDGLWTSIYLASQAFRYAVTRDPSAKANANRAMEAMSLLHNITGIKGLFSRSALAPGEVLDPGGYWWNSTTMPGWMWKGDASADEMCGHAMGYPIFYALVAEQSQKQRISDLLTVTLDYIMANNWTLIDITGKRTQWGFWDPHELNEVPEFYDQRGLNSLQILQMLSSAWVITGNVKYMNAIKELGVKYEYYINIINQKITTPGDDNFSDDELAYTPYMGYFFQSLTHSKYEYHPFFVKSIQRAWKNIWPGHSSLWAFITSMALPSGSVKFDGPLENLQRWPVEVIDWSWDNSGRIDFQMDPSPNRSGKLQSSRAFAPDEGPTMRWNADPFELSGGDGGRNEHDPSAYLVSYWLGRYLKIIKETD